MSDVFDGYAALVTIVAPAGITPTVIRDPADDAFATLHRRLNVFSVE